MKRYGLWYRLGTTQAGRRHGRYEERFDGGVTAPRRTEVGRMRSDRIEKPLLALGLCLLLIFAPTAATAVALPTPHDPSLQELAGYNAALELDPNDVPTLRARGSTFRALELYDDALIDLERAEKIDPGNPETVCEIGICFYMLGEVQRGLETLLRSEQLLLTVIEEGTWELERHGPVERELRATLMTIYREAGEFDAAMDQCLALEKYLAGKLAFKCDKADLLIPLGRIEEALELYEDVVEWNNVFERFCVGLANCYLLIDLPEKALEVFQNWSREEPDMALPHMFGALVLAEHLDRPEQAAAEETRAFELANAQLAGEDFFDFEDLIVMARVHQTAKRFEESVRVLEGLIEYSRGHYLVVHLQAVNYLATGRVEDGGSFEREAQVYRRLNPNDWLQAYELLSASEVQDAQAPSSDDDPKVVAAASEEGEAAGGDQALAAGGETGPPEPATERETVAFPIVAAAALFLLLVVLRRVLRRK